MTLIQRIKQRAIWPICDFIYKIRIRLAENRAIRHGTCANWCKVAILRLRRQKERELRDLEAKRSPSQLARMGK